MVVALTGGVAAGKTQVSDRFAALGVPIIDTDLLAREAVLPGTAGLVEITRRFGTEMLNDDGSLNRRKLRDTVFRSEAERMALERILHPEIRRLTQQRIHQLGNPASGYCLVVIPLLAESGVPGYAHRVLLVSVSPEIRKRRLMARDEISADAAERMIAAQATPEQRRAIADDVIVNDGTLQELDEQVATLHSRYRQLARENLRPRD